MQHHHTAPGASPLTGIALVSLAALLWGTTGTAQQLGAGGLSPFWVGAAQLAVASGFFCCAQALARWRRRRAAGAPGAQAAAQPAPGNAPRPRVPLSWLALASAGIGGYSIAFYAGVRLAGVGVGTAVAIGSSPVWAGLIQALVQRAAPPLLWWLGVAVSVAGGGLMALARGAAQVAPSWAGLGLCLLAGLAYASYALVNKRLVARAPAGWVNLRVFSGAALLALPVAALLAGTPRFGPASLALVLYLGVVVSGLAYVAFSGALRHIQGATAVTLSLIEPAAAFALALLVLGERPPAPAFWGLAGLLAGLGLVIWAELRGAR
ncbi:drug/metabolite transporter, DME family [Oryzisolibacter propanilivorax]|uniref:Drug/metabolite transporter, DME family n=1 Tax=Oryzisolibacter propanilivorax TaxID=1527607 RepID=A0A1G9QRF4_9BURK|nr:EamA family transporter [Oryzisolibacter propanilivorax]SDM13431.1 drug/metabolite transporter, DME family [Oryzisolibacter propanilivorax]